MSELLVKTSGGRRNFAGPRTERVKFLRSCVRLALLGKQRAGMGKTQVSEDMRQALIETYAYGVLNQQALGAISTLHRGTVNRVLSGQPKQSPLRGTLTAAAFGVLLEAYEQYHRGEKVVWSAVSTEMVNMGCSIGLAMSLTHGHMPMQLPNDKSKRPVRRKRGKYKQEEEESHESERVDDLLPELPTEDQGHPQESEGDSGDLRTDQAGGEPGASEEVIAGGESGEVPGAAERDSDPEPEPTGLDAIDAYLPKLDPASFDTEEELERALESGRCRWPEWRYEDIDEVGDDLLAESGVEVPSDWEPDYAPLEQVEEDEAEARP